MQYLKNEALPVIRSDWKGNPFHNNEFQYLDTPFRPSFRQLFKWQTSRNPQREEKKAETWTVPVSSTTNFLQAAEDFITWLGHASFLIQINGIRLVIDPVLYDLPFIKRQVSVPFPIEALEGIDYLLLSHDHRDHCDKKSIQNLLGNNTPAKILTSLGMSRTIKSWVEPLIIEEAGWYQKYQTEGGVDIYFMPSRHWSRRGLFDFNRVLWGSFVIQHGNKTIYFGADSGPGDHFSEIGQLFPEIDVAMIGIGAYAPDYMMQEIHTSPEQATDAFLQLGAKKLIPMHYGTYDLSDEPMGEPYRWIKQIFEEQKMLERLILARVGEAITI